MQYISREDYCEENCGKENREGYKTCKNCAMLNVPSVDIQPIRRGRWLGDEVIQCSNCNFTLNRASFGHIVHKYFDYCPNCGAKMKNAE